MSSTSEVGHTKNVANFEILIANCSGFGTAYNPSKSSIKVPALNSLLSNAKSSLVVVNTAFVPCSKAKNARAIAFTPLSPLVTRIFAALDATDASKQVVANAKTLKRKLQGSRSSEKIAPVPLLDENSSEDTVKQISDSQLSFDNKIEHFSRLILILAGEPLYLPNEAELKVPALTALLTTLRATNSAVVNATIPLDNARISRNKILYLPEVGLYDIQKQVKKYVKSVFGARSPEFKKISKLKFKNYPLV